MKGIQYFALFAFNKLLDEKNVNMLFLFQYLQPRPSALCYFAPAWTWCYCWFKIGFPSPIGPLVLLLKLHSELLPTFFGFRPAKYFWCKVFEPVSRQRAGFLTIKTQFNINKPSVDKGYVGSACVVMCRQVQGVFKQRYRDGLLNNSKHKEVKSTILFSGVHNDRPGEC